MEENVQHPSLVSHAVRSGVIVGGITVILTLLIYLIDPALMVSMWMFLFLILITVLVVIFGIQYRNQTTGYMTFGNAFKHGLYTLIVAGLVGLLFNLLLHQVIDPELKDYLTDVTTENTLSMARGFGAEDAAIDQMEADTRERAASSYTVMGQITGFGISLIIYLVLALITGAIVKKKNPEDEI
jgi:hypothetical protein